MVWREPQNYMDDCYFCMVIITGMNRTTKSSIQYPNLPLALRPVDHCNEVPVSIFTALEISDDDESFHCIHSFIWRASKSENFSLTIKIYTTIALFLDHYSINDNRLKYIIKELSFVRKSCIYFDFIYRISTSHLGKISKNIKVSRIIFSICRAV